MLNTLYQRAIIAGAMLSLAALTGCGSASAPSASSAAAATVTTTVSGSNNGGGTTATTTMITTTPSGNEPVVSPNGTKGEFDVADNFDVQPTLEPTVETIGVSPDPVGAFRFTCAPGQVSHDDPIVYPGQPGKSHLHQFFGNTLTNANSTYQSLRTTGGSTCTMSTDVSPQRSAYWQPAMLDGAGNVVKPDYALTYYKTFPSGNPECKGPPDATHIGWCIGMPNGLRMIMGANMATGVYTTAPGGNTTGVFIECVDGTNHQSLTGWMDTIAAVVASGKCNAPGALLHLNVGFPSCWDGKNLDTADHRSHVAYGTGAIIDNYQAACPADHPYVIPQISLQTFFTLDANFFAGKWHLASDEMVPGYVAGQTMHADYWEAWSPVVKNDWQTGCIDKHLSCNVGEMGNGQSIKGMNPSDFGGYPVHLLVALASILI